MAVLFGAWLKDADRRSPTVAPETPPRRALE
jgi:hypothetical protein